MFFPTATSINIQFTYFGLWTTMVSRNRQFLVIETENFLFLKCRKTSKDRLLKSIFCSFSRIQDQKKNHQTLKNTTHNDNVSYGPLSTENINVYIAKCFMNARIH